MPLVVALQFPFIGIKELKPGILIWDGTFKEQIWVCWLGIQMLCDTNTSCRVLFIWFLGNITQLLIFIFCHFIISLLFYYSAILLYLYSEHYKMYSSRQQYKHLICIVFKITRTAGLVSIISEWSVTFYLFYFF